MVTGIALLMGASLACNFWFFYSFLDSGVTTQDGFKLWGIQLYTLPFIAGLVGCGAQLFVYAFVGNLSRIKGFVFKLFLCVVSSLTMGLTVMSTYSTLDSFLIAKTVENEKSGFIEDQKRALLESRSKDMATLSAAANQAVNDKYRSQGKLTADANEQLRKQQQELIESMDVKEVKAPSPLDSLIRIFGTNQDLKPYFCAWLALMFDLLPILGIAMLGKLEKQDIDYKRDVEEKERDIKFESIRNSNLQVKREPVPSVKKEPELVPEKNTLVTRDINPERKTETTVRDFPNQVEVVKNNEQQQSVVEDEKHTTNIYEYITDKPLVYTKVPKSELSKRVDDIDSSILDPIIIKALYNHEIPLSYNGVGEFTGLSKWKVQKFFERAIENGYIINKTDQSIAEGYAFTKTIRYHLNRKLNIVETAGVQ